MKHTHKSLLIGIGLQDIRMCNACVCVIYNYNFIYFECPKSTGAKPYSRPRTLGSTGAKVPVAPVESAPMHRTHRILSNGCEYVGRVFTPCLTNLKTILMAYCLLPSLWCSKVIASCTCIVSFKKSKCITVVKPCITAEMLQ